MDVYKNVPNSLDDSTHNSQLLHLIRNLIKKETKQLIPLISCN